MTDDITPTFKGITLVSADVMEDGRIVITRHCPDHTEQIVFDDQFELETILMELTDRLPKATCPKCQMQMAPWYVKEYTCEKCNTTYSENYLEYYDEIEKFKAANAKGEGEQ